MNTVTRVALHDEIIRTREKFQRWLVTIPAHVLQKPSKDPEWTNSEILYAISVSPLVIKSALKRNSGDWASKLSTNLTSKFIILKTHETYIRSHASDATLWELAKEYEENCNRVLTLLDEVSDTDLQKVLTIPKDETMLSGEFTVEQLFHFVKSYFDSQRRNIEIGT